MLQPGPMEMANWHFLTLAVEIRGEYTLRVIIYDECFRCPTCCSALKPNATGVNKQGQISHFLTPPL